MLLPRDDDDDDNHLCIKCNATVVGLDNYVKHRKQRCGKVIKLETSKTVGAGDIASIDTLDSTYNLGADVFFQSLELQSSVKKTSLSRLTPPISMSKTGLDPKTALVEASTSRDLPRMSPLETNLREEDWIGGHTLRINGHEDNQTKLINAVASISRSFGTSKKESPSSSYNIGAYNDFKDFDESEESEEEDEEDPPESDNKWKPSPNYTGGKWRPASPDHEDWDMREEQEHTGGKWKPIMAESNERDDDYDAPPPGHTKGKWVPGHEKTQIMQPTIQSKGSVQYWCGPCNRRLGSRAIYEKHLMSSLHMKKVLPEHELEFSGHLEPMRSVKRPTRPSRFTDDSIYTQPPKKVSKTPKQKLTVKIGKKKRKRKPVFVHCSGCKSRVRLHLMGKHLISHYHFRKATDVQSEAYQQLILDNIDAIVHQSPFQCSPCKFYTNWLSNFMQHWFSEEHENKMASIEGRIWCSFCKFDCKTSQDMLQHLSGPDHNEVVAVINRSMPIIIRKKSIIACETCKKEFKYNIEIKRHCRNTSHKLPFSATDDYQDIRKCQRCNAKFKTSVSLAHHLKYKHKQEAYYCLTCSLTFKTFDEARRHRYTSAHRTKRKEILIRKGIAVKPMSKKCPYCTDKVVLKSVIELKEHIRTVHPEIKKRCLKCGMSFVLFQEVSRHVRNKACQFQDLNNLDYSIVWNCSQCLFSTDSQAECYFHEVLHTDTIKEYKKSGDGEKLVEKYPCPICSKIFRKRYLRQHLRLHTYERPFTCSTCGANFTSQSSLSNHSKNNHQVRVKDDPKKKVVASDDSPPKDNLKCNICSKTFSNRSALSRHVCDSVRCCPDEGCTYVATTLAQLTRHRTIHGVNLKNHECNLCPFKTNQSSHMERHLRCHKGLKPYSCPHCEFICGSLENLRKHVLRSGRHPGKYLYSCQSCAYLTNTATELRAHLTKVHADKYDAKSAVQAVKYILIKNNEPPINPT